MGIEGFIIPWIFANLLVFVVASRSIVHDFQRSEAKFGAISIARRDINPSGFWAAISMKGAFCLLTGFLAFLAARPVFAS
jgi:hypothetical protein